MYSLQVLDHYKNPRNVGIIKDADGQGVVGTPANGDMMKLTLKISQNRIVGAKFKAFGCPTAIAASSVVTELIRGLSISEALKITHQHIDSALGGLPPDKARYAMHAEETLKAAIDDYTSRM